MSVFILNKTDIFPVLTLLERTNKLETVNRILITRSKILVYTNAFFFSDDLVCLLKYIPLHIMPLFTYILCPINLNLHSSH